MAQPSDKYAGYVLGAIDQKHRLVIPAPVRAVIETKCPGDNSIHLRIDGELGCLIGYDSDYMARRGAAFDALEARWLEEDARDRRRLRREWAQVQCFGFDSSGRIGLPDFFQEEAKLGDVTLYVGHYSHFEIWNPERYLASDVDALDKRWVESLLKGRK